MCQPGEQRSAAAQPCPLGLLELLPVTRQPVRSANTPSTDQPPAQPARRGIVRVSRNSSRTPSAQPVAGAASTAASRAASLAASCEASLVCRKSTRPQLTTAALTIPAIVVIDRRIACLAANRPNLTSTSVRHPPWLRRCAVHSLRFGPCQAGQPQSTALLGGRNTNRKPQRLDTSRTTR